MLTIFSVPKPFRGETTDAQDNAIRSWRASNPTARIALCGRDEGIAEACVRNEVTHLPDLETSDFGTPVLSSVFAQVFATYPSEQYLFVNCDIILLDDIGVLADRLCCLESFLGVARRTNVDLTGRLDTEESGWDKKVRRVAETSGVLADPANIDWFLMKGEGPWTRLPPFIVGRPGWDNWMVFATKKAGIPVVDCSVAIVVVHQNHGYGHVPNRVGPKWGGPEAAVNQKLAESGGSFNRSGQVFSIAHSTHRLDGRAVRRNLSLSRLRAEYRLAPNSLPALSGLLYWIHGVHGC